MPNAARLAGGWNVEQTRPQRSGRKGIICVREGAPSSDQVRVLAALHTSDNGRSVYSPPIIILSHFATRFVDLITLGSSSGNSASPASGEAG